MGVASERPGPGWWEGGACRDHREQQPLEGAVE